ncbi:MAG: PadR family transcriptional regulator [Nocardioidaceae bacterium]
MSQERPLPTTAYALLGLLSFGQELTGYELKQWADSTLRFYWVAPAMSQIYTELGRLRDRGLVDALETEGPGARVSTRYRINGPGSDELRRWLTESTPEFPVLKHPVALRLLLGHLIDPGSVRMMLEEYDAALAERRRELQQVLDRIEDDPAFRFPAFVARWGLSYYDTEAAVVEEVRDDLAD